MRMYDGFGSGRRCAPCNVPIEEHQIEYELDFPGPDRARLPQWTMQLHLHLPCHHAWNLEREGVREGLCKLPERWASSGR